MVCREVEADLHQKSSKTGCPPRHVVVSKMAAGDATLLARKLWKKSMIRSLLMKRTSSLHLVGSTGVEPITLPDVIVNVVIQGIDADTAAVTLSLVAGGVFMV